MIRIGRKLFSAHAVLIMRAIHVHMCSSGAPLSLAVNQIVLGRQIRVLDYSACPHIALGKYPPRYLLYAAKGLVALSSRVSRKMAAPHQ